MWAEGKVRIVDVADALGLSTATVSNVIHGKTQKISAKTVQRVQQKLQETGYIPNMAATLLAQNNSRIIGIVVNDHPKYEGRVLMDPFVGASVNYLCDELEVAGYYLMLRKAHDIMSAVQFASMWNMDGMILMGFCAAEYQRLRDAIRIPFVVYDGCVASGRGVCNIQIDDRTGGQLMGEHFLQLGHQHVLFAADNDTNVDRARYVGFSEGLGYTPDYLIVPQQTADRTPFYAHRLAHLRQYTAIFMPSDYYATDLMHFLLGAGVRVPEDISIAGFDDGYLSQTTVPSLTTVRQNMAERAKVAVRLLNRMKKDPNYSEDVLLPVELVPRKSTAIPRAAAN